MVSEVVVHSSGEGMAEWLSLWQWDLVFLHLVSHTGPRTL